MKTTLANGQVEYAFYDTSGKLRYSRKGTATVDYIDLDGKAFVERSTVSSTSGGGTTGTTTGSSGGTSTGTLGGGTLGGLLGGRTGGTSGGGTGGLLGGLTGGGLGGLLGGNSSGGVTGGTSPSSLGGTQDEFSAAAATKTTITYLHPDWLGSPRMATDATGTVVWREHFDPYGKKLNGVNEKRGYTGHAYDPETGLTYMLARYYDADVGRFMMTDPIGSKDDLNLYAYVGGNPTNGTDPTGTSCAGSLLGDCDSGGTSPDNVASLNNPEYTGSRDASNPQSAAGIAAKAANEGSANTSSGTENSPEDTEIRLDHIALPVGNHAEAQIINPDENGNDQRVFGGPDRRGKGLLDLIFRSIATALGGHQFGNVFARTAEVTKGARPDSVATTSARVLVSYENAVHGAQDYVRKIVDSQTRYSAIGPNSNSVSYGLIIFLGGTPPPPPVFTPGASAFPFKE